MTTQARELLNYEGHTRGIHAMPLKGCDRPVPRSRGFSTACRRGYVGTWEFRDDTLHLVQLESFESIVSRDGHDLLREMFPEADGSVAAVWYSGEIVSANVTDPEDTESIRRRAELELAVHVVAFTSVVRLGKLLLETATDLKTGGIRSRLTRHAKELFPGDEFAFLTAIQARPDDTTAKLVYADWLEDRGDPRALLIREEISERVRDGPRPPRYELGALQSLPTGYVPPEDVEWFWRHLAGIPVHGLGDQRP
jgi:uncharacterized protein (TIGR02996 family)